MGDMLKLLVIDLDGTLVDSAPDLMDAVNAALAAVALPLASDAQVRSWIGDGVDVLVERALAGQGGDPVAQFAPARAAFGDTYSKQLFVRSTLYPGVPETLDRLREAGLKLACVTNKRESYARDVLDQAGIADRFALLIGGDTLPRKKPDPLPLVHAATVLGATPAESAMVGDSHHDHDAARAAGFAFFWASYGYCDDPGPLDPPRSQRIDAFGELVALLA